MYRAEISLTVLKYIGIFPPKKFSNAYLSIYNCLSVLIICLIYIFTTSTIIELLISGFDVEEFTENLFYVLALIAACVKMTTAFIKRSKIMKLIEMLLDQQCSPRDMVEFNIQKKINKIARTATIIFVIFVTITVLARSLTPLANGLIDATLPYKAWAPYDLENRILFWLTFFGQTVSSMITGQATVAVDTFAMVMMLQLSAQLKILKHRIQKLPQLYMKESNLNAKKEEIIIGMWIQHHNSMHIFGNNLNNIYSFIFFSQLLATTINVCTSSYLLAVTSAKSPSYWSMLISLGSVMFQICLYCWHGNLVIEKSREIGFAAYNTEWLLLSNRSKTNLIHIMRRSTKPIKFTAGSIIPISIDTFASILRLSYSIYSCLIQTS